MRHSFRQFSLTAWPRRLRYLVSRLAGSRLQKSQQVYGVDVNGERFKRIILRDSYLAARIEQALENFGPSPCVPGFVIRYEHEVWVDFVPGEVPATVDERLVREVAAFYAQIYAHGAREETAAGSIWAERLHRDLGFLARVGVLSADVRAALAARVQSMTPDQFWIGFDYNDPVVKNFVRTAHGGLCGIDVESLVEEQLLGLGVAKALMRWMEPYRACFLEAYVSAGGPDFQPYFAFVELAHLAAYTKLMFVERKWANVDDSRFERFL